MQVINFANGGTGACNGNRSQPITFTFANAISSFGFLAVVNGGNIVFNTNNGTAAVPSAFNWNTGQAGYVGVTDNTSFNTITVTSDYTGYMVIDDVTYTTAAPEPASMAL